MGVLVPYEARDHIKQENCMWPIIHFLAAAMPEQFFEVDYFHAGSFAGD